MYQSYDSCEIQLELNVYAFSYADSIKVVYISKFDVKSVQI